MLIVGGSTTHSRCGDAGGDRQPARGRRQTARGDESPGGAGAGDRDAGSEGVGLAGRCARGDRERSVAMSRRRRRAADAVLVGPGMEATPATRRVATAILRRAKAVVLDAGALACGDGASRAGACVLTPHSGEMAGVARRRRIGSRCADPSTSHCARHADRRDRCAEGPRHGDREAPRCASWLHTGGCAGLGTSGSGDVLAGLICGLMAQGVPPDQAAVWGVALHGRAGEALSREVGTTGFLAREIAARIPAIRDGLSARRA